MPDISSAQLGTVLDRHMRDKDLSNELVGSVLNLHPLTIGRFRKNKTNPHRETLESIEQWLKEEEALTRLNIPTDLGPLADQPPARADATDREQLAGMGLTLAQPTMKGEKKHYGCCFLEDWDFALAVQAFMNSPMPEADKKRLLGQLFTQDFPSLHDNL